MHHAESVIGWLAALFLSATLSAQEANLAPGDLKIITTSSYESSSPRPSAWPADTRTTYLHGQRFRQDFEAYVGGSPPPDKAAAFRPLRTMRLFISAI